MKRINTVTHQDVSVLMKYLCNLQLELITWQKFTVRETPDGLIESITDRHSFIGDRNVIISCMGLQKKLDEIIKKSKNKNERKENEQ